VTVSQPPPIQPAGGQERREENRMRSLPLWMAALVLLAGLALTPSAVGHPELARRHKAACVTCHVNPAGGAELTAAGKTALAPKAKIAPITTGAAQYVGSARCQSCHLTQAKAWKETAHAHALENLRSAHDDAIAAMSTKLKIKLAGPPAETRACIVCHVTGLELQGGYPAPDSARTAALAVVGCESCHGPGSRHVSAPLADKKKTIHGAVSEKTCVQCHTPVITPTFDFAEMKKTGTHLMKATE
jgi:hypothetical protein